MPSRRAVFLDRDGVLLHNIIRDGKPYAITSLEEARIIEGAAEACAMLKSMGFLLVMITNQPDAKRGRTPRAVIEQVNGTIAARLRLDGVQVCFHDNDDDCDCRKPRPGLILAAARQMDIALEQSFMVGDRWKDVAAGRAAGCRTIFVDHHYAGEPQTSADCIVSSLLDSVPWISAQAAQ